MANRFKKAAEARAETSPTPIMHRAEIIEDRKAPEKSGGVPSGGKLHSGRLVEEEKEMVGFSIKIPVKMHEAMKLHYAQTGEKMTAYIKRLIENDMGKRF